MKKQIYLFLRKINLENIIVLLFLKKGYLKSTGWLRTCFSKKSINSTGEPIPWLTYSLIMFLEARLNKNQTVYEFGCGNSTIWFSKKVKHIRSIEHDGDWYYQIKDKLPSNVDFIYRDILQKKIPYGQLVYYKPIDNEPYINEIIESGNKYDIIIIDGIFRNASIEKSLNCLSDAGVLIVDNLDFKDDMETSIKLLKNNGFKLLEFWGMSPIIPTLSCSGIFYKERNCLGI